MELDGLHAIIGVLVVFMFFMALRLMRLQGDQEDIKDDYESKYKDNHMYPHSHHYAHGYRYRPYGYYGYGPRWWWKKRFHY